MRLFIAILILTVGFSGSEISYACNTSCAESELPWWRFLFYPVAGFAVVWLYRWWFVPPAGIGFAPDDPDKLAAEKEARRCLPLFWQAFENPELDEHDFAVKFNLTPHKEAEHIWACDLRRKVGVLYGKLANEPLEPGYEPDTFYPIAEELIVDWTYSKGSEAKGHYVTRVMMERMPKRFVAKAKKELGWA
jgi:uncharacterized protein YegJ (DUF2314 family)